MPFRRRRSVSQIRCPRSPRVASFSQELVRPTRSGEIGHRPAPQLIHRPAVHQGKGGIHALDGLSVGADDGHPPAGMLEDPGPPLQLPSRLHPEGDVAPYADDAGYLAAGAAEGRKRGLHVVNATAGTKYPVIGDRFTRQRGAVGLLVNRRGFRPDDLVDRFPDQTGRP